MPQFTEHSGIILLYFLLEETPSDLVVFRSTPDAGLSCGKENRELYGDFWNPSNFFWLCCHPLQCESSLFREQHGLRIEKSIGYRILNTSFLLLGLGHQPYFFYNFIRLCFKNSVAV